jgi:hypothetical protein
MGREIFQFYIENYLIKNYLVTALVPLNSPTPLFGKKESSRG